MAFASPVPRACAFFGSANATLAAVGISNLANVPWSGIRDYQAIVGIEEGEQGLGQPLNTHLSGYKGHRVEAPGVT